MISSARVVSIVFHIFVWSLLNTFSNGTETDIYCLKSIKHSLEDPHKRLNNGSSSWNFNNKTEGFVCKFKGLECWHPDENKILNIRLSNMGLKGQFPRGIENCTSLQTLDLSSNDLSGPIPSDIALIIPFLTSLNLSYNRFSGVIPPSLANCSFLNVLVLNNNQLTGEIPMKLSQLDRINTFSVASNSLSGPVPNFSNIFVTPAWYANNEGLCGGPLRSCTEHRQKFDDYFIRGFAVGWVVSAISVIAVAAFIMPSSIPVVHAKKMETTIMPIMRTWLTRWKNKRKEAYSLREGSKEISILEKLVTRISLAEVITATSNFSKENIIGLGKMGTMYKGVLMNGLMLLAVRRFRDFQHFEKQFISEVTTLGRVRHRNLVPLFGFCVDGKERLLVYMYMANGNLYDWLHPLEANSKFLEWHLRVRIGIGLARGLAWLHHNSKLRITHGNISSQCILLDQNFEPKISNFGRSKILKSNESNSINKRFSEKRKRWRLGFATSENELLLDVSKEDVYSFGVVLLEIVTGEKPNQVSNASAGFSGTLVEWITHLWDASCPYNAIDKLLAGRGFDGEIIQFLELACNCVKSSPNERPTMLEVYRILSDIGEAYGIADDSEIPTQNKWRIASQS